MVADFASSADAHSSTISSLDETIALANQTTESIEASSAEDAAEQPASPIDFIVGLPDNVGNAVSGLTDDAQKALNGFIEALAVMIVTSCIISCAAP